MVKRKKIKNLLSLKNNTILPIVFIVLILIIFSVIMVYFGLFEQQFINFNNINYNNSIEENGWNLTAYSTYELGLTSINTGGTTVPEENCFDPDLRECKFYKTEVLTSPNSLTNNIEVYHNIDGGDNPTNLGKAHNYLKINELINITLLKQITFDSSVETQGHFNAQEGSEVRIYLADEDSGNGILIKRYSGETLTEEKILIEKKFKEDELSITINDQTQKTDINNKNKIYYLWLIVETGNSGTTGSGTTGSILAENIEYTFYNPIINETQTNNNETGENEDNNETNGNMTDNDNNNTSSNNTNGSNGSQDDSEDVEDESDMNLLIILSIILGSIILIGGIIFIIVKLNK